MTGATLKTELALETRLIAWVYLGAIVLGCGSAFITSHTSFKIVTSGTVPPPELRSAPVAAPPKVVPEPATLKFGFPDPVELDPFVEPVVDMVAQSPERSQPFYALNGGRVVAMALDGMFKQFEFGAENTYLPNSVVIDTALAWQKTRSFQSYVAMEQVEKSFAPKLVVEETRAVAPKLKSIMADLPFEFANAVGKTAGLGMCSIGPLATHKVGTPAVRIATHGLIDCTPVAKPLYVMEKPTKRMNFYDGSAHDPSGR